MTDQHPRSRAVSEADARNRTGDPFITREGETADSVASGHTPSPHGTPPPPREDHTGQPERPQNAPSNDLEPLPPGEYNGLNGALGSLTRALLGLPPDALDRLIVTAASYLEAERTGPVAGLVRRDLRLAHAYRDLHDVLLQEAER